MDISWVLALAVFSFVMSGTPGPNNIMLLASGAQFGFLRTLPHMLGISLGMVILLTSVLLGLGALFALYPPLYVVLKWVGGAYLLWLAWKISCAQVADLGADDPTSSKPMRWWQAALFQFINPKAWMMSISAIGAFSISGDVYVESGVWIVIIFWLVNFPTISLWAGLGVGIRRLLTNAKRQKIFNITMGGVTALTLVMIVGN